MYVWRWLGFVMTWRLAWWQVSRMEDEEGEVEKEEEEVVEREVQLTLELQRALVSLPLTAVSYHLRRLVVIYSVNSPVYCRS